MKRVLLAVVLGTLLLNAQETAPVKKIPADLALAIRDAQVAKFNLDQAVRFIEAKLADYKAQQKDADTKLKAAYDAAYKAGGVSDKDFDVDETKWEFVKKSKEKPAEKK